MYKENFEFKLEKPIEAIDKTGKKIEINLLTLNAPTMKSLKVYAKFKHLIVNGMMKARSYLQGEKSEKIEQEAYNNSLSIEENGKNMLPLIYALEIDITYLFDVFKEFLLSAGIIDDKLFRVTENLIDRMSPADFECLLGAYVGIFLSSLGNN